MLRREEAESGVLATGAMIALILGGAGITVATGWTGALGYLADGNGLDGGSAKTLSLLGTVGLSSGIFTALAAMELASGYLLVRGSSVPKWIGWIGLCAALLALAGAFSVAKSGPFVPFGFFTFAGFLSFSAYIVLLSAFMLKRAE